MIRRISMLISAGLVATMTACTAPAPAPSTSTSTLPRNDASTGSAGPTIQSTSSACTAHVVAGDSANGSTLCVTRGTDLTVLLHTTAGSGWATPEMTGDALGPARPLPTPAGSVGWSFPAVAAGTAEVSTSRSLCPPRGPGAMRCHGKVVYLLHVRVG